jgi:ankyrin repeat protein
MVQYLAEKQCDLNTQGKDGMRLLDVAVLKHNLEKTRFLLEQNARSCKSDMHIVAAARWGFVELLQRFLDVRDDMKVRADKGESPLQVACES